MKKKMFVFLMIALVASGLSAQEAPEKTKIYRTWISLSKEPYKIRGVLYQVNDSSILVSNSFKIQDYSLGRYATVELNIEHIMKIDLRDKNSVRNGALVGAVAGLAFGGIVGYAEGGSYFFSATETALIVGVPFSIVGAGLGAFIGSSKVVIPINGSLRTFNRNKNKLREYSIIK